MAKQCPRSEQDDHEDDPLTPPALPSFSNLPPTPPPSTNKPATAGVQKLLDFCKQLEHGKAPPRLGLGSRIFRLEPGAYDDFLQRTCQDLPLKRYIEDKLRLEHSADGSQVTIRMPSPTHELFRESLVYEINNQLHLRRQQDDILGNWLEQVHAFGSADVKLGVKKSDTTTDRHSSRSPDITFQYNGARYPGLVIEVGYTQQAKKLEKVADDLILNSNGNIRMVVGFDTLRPQTPVSQMYIWRPNFQELPNGDKIFSCKETLRMEFRNGEGSPNDVGIALTITPSDLTIARLLPACDTSEAIVTITSAKLYSLLQGAERSAQKAVEQGDADELPSGYKRRKRESTPPEEIATSDEAVYQTQEEAAEERSNNADKDWEGRRRQRRRL